MDTERPEGRFAAPRVGSLFPQRRQIVGYAALPLVRRLRG
ncbi:MAG: hypothetical protein RL417_419 [Pseudomonadota bacterium]|jgi:hypothetical protein